MPFGATRSDDSDEWASRCAQDDTHFPAILGQMRDRCRGQKKGACLRRREGAEGSPLGRRAATFSTSGQSAATKDPVRRKPCFVRDTFSLYSSRPIPERTCEDPVRSNPCSARRTYPAHARRVAAEWRFSAAPNTPYVRRRAPQPCGCGSTPWRSVTRYAISLQLVTSPV